MWSTARDIAAGDLVIVWLTRDELQPLLITPGKEFNGKFGVYSHSDLVGVPYGSKILYLADIAFIVSYLNIKPGSCVVEAGTGSGSFSHSVARTIGQTGRLYSYEFHETRASKAREEFREHGLSDRITLTHRNVCKDGFTVTDQADSVFLDLPAPWDAIENAKQAMRKDRMARICCFSPCMEQVMRTVTALNDAGFTDITMYETLMRPHEVHFPPPLRPVSEISADLKHAAEVREQKRLQQIASSQARRAQLVAAGGSVGKKRKRGTQDQGSAAVAPIAGEGEATRVKEEKSLPQSDAADGKKLRTEERGSGLPAALDPDSDSTASLMTASGNPAAQPSTLSAVAVLANTPAPTYSAASVTVVPEMSERPSDAAADEVTKRIVRDEAPAHAAAAAAAAAAAYAPPKIGAVAKVMHDVRGHTSYLTFAVLLPTAVLPEERDKSSAVSDKNGEKGEIEMADVSATASATDVVAGGEAQSMEIAVDGDGVAAAANNT